MIEGRRHFVGIQESMHPQDMGFNISGGASGSERGHRAPALLELLSTTEHEVKAAVGLPEREAARIKKRTAIRAVLEEPAKSLPVDINRYVVGQHGPDGKLLLPNSHYSQYLVVITFRKDGKTLSFDETRDNLIDPTVTTLAERDEDRAEVDKLVRANTKLLYEEPIDIYNRSLAEISAIHKREKLIREEQRKAGAEPDTFVYDDRMVRPLATALRYASETDFIPEPEISLSESSHGNDIQVGFPRGFVIGWPVWTRTRQHRRFKFSSGLTYIKFPLYRLEEMSAAFDAGNTKPLNKAGRDVLRITRNAGVENSS